MTKAEKAKLQKRARKAVLGELLGWLETKKGLCTSGWPDGKGIFVAGGMTDEDTALRRELRRAVRLVRSGAK